MRNRSIPDDVIEAVLKKTDIVQLVGRTVALSKRGRSYLGLCPFHSEKTPSFHVLPDKQIFHCFGCGAGGNAIRFLMKSESLPFPDAVRLLAEEYGVPHAIPTAPAVMSEEDREAARLIQAHEETAKFYRFVLGGTEQGQAAYAYLQRRGFTQKLIDQFGIGYAPPLRDSLTQFLISKQFDVNMLEKAGLAVGRTDQSGYFDRFRDRIMFPIWDASGKLVAFNGRAVGDAQPKYLHSPETSLFHKNKILYPLHLAKAAIRKAGRAVLFEGMVDVIKAWEAGIDNGVASLGTALTESHIELLKRYCDRILICYDGDRAGMSAASRSVILCEKFGMKAEVAMLPDGMDPDEYIAAHGPDAFVGKIIQTAVPSTTFKILSLKKEHSTGDEAGSLAFVRSALRIVAELGSPTEREHYARELSAESGYSFETLKQELNELRQKMRGSRDKNENPWNTDMNEIRRPEKAVPALRPAYYVAERQLLSAMMHSDEAAGIVRHSLGGEFFVEAHAALAAYIYAYYAQGKPPNPGGFIGSLHDDALEAVASSILAAFPEQSLNDKVIEHALLEVRKRGLELSVKHLKQQQRSLARAERAEEVLEVARIGTEIIALEKELKQLSQRI